MTQVIWQSNLFSGQISLSALPDLLKTSMSLVLEVPVDKNVLHLLMFIARKYSIINANFKPINPKIHLFYSIDTQPFESKDIP